MGKGLKLGSWREEVGLLEPQLIRGLPILMSDKVIKIPRQD